MHFVDKMGITFADNNLGPKVTLSKDHVEKGPSFSVVKNCH